MKWLSAAVMAALVSCASVPAFAADQRQMPQPSPMEEAFRLGAQTGASLTQREADWKATFKAWCADRPACGLASGMVDGDAGAPALVPPPPLAAMPAPAPEPPSPCPGGPCHTTHPASLDKK